MFGTVPNFGSLGSLGLMQGLNAGGSAGQAPDMNAMVEVSGPFCALICLSVLLVVSLVPVRTAYRLAVK